MPKRRKNRNEPLLTLVILFFIGALILPLGMSRDAASSSLISIILGGGVVLSVVIIGAIFWKLRQQHRALEALRLADVSRMSGVDFERYVGALLQSRGYRVTYTKASGDYGVDIIAKRNRVSTAIQVKRYSKTLNQDAVRQAVAGMSHYGCTASMVVTNSFFTPAAKTLAASNQCALIDGEKLGEWIQAFRK